MLDVNPKTFYSSFISQLTIQFVYFSLPLIDMLMLSAVDSRLAGGVGQGAVLVNVVLSMFGGFMYVLINLYNQSQGGERPWTLQRSLNFCFSLAVLMAPIIMALVLLGTKIFSWMALPELTSQYAREYAQVLGAGAFLTLLCHSSLNHLRSRNQNKAAITAVLVGTVVNFALNILVIKYGSRVGLSAHRGVALATIVAEVAIVNYALHRLGISWSELLNFKRDNIFRQRELLRVVIRKGAGLGLSNSNDWLLSFVLVLLVGKFGEIVVAGNQVADTTASLMYRFVHAGCGTVALLLTQAWGTLQEKKITFLHFRKQALSMFGYCLLPVALMGVMVFLFRPQILSLFSLLPGHGDFAVAHTLIGIHLGLLGVYFLQHIFASYLSVMLETEIQGLITSLVSYLIILPLALHVVSRGLGPQYIWLSEGLGITFICTLYAWRLRKTCVLQSAK